MIVAWKPRSCSPDSGHRDEHGQLLAMTCVLMTMFLALAGLVSDGGKYLDAQQAAVAEAQQAARAGAGSIDADQLHSDDIQIDPGNAVAAAESYMEDAGHPGSAWVQGDTVHVQITYRQPTQLLGIIGIGGFQINVSTSATNVAGITSGG